MEVLGKSKLVLDLYYSDKELGEMGLKLLNGHKMNYVVYEKNATVYFFEKLEEDLFRLFCKTSRKSFYLS